MIAAKVETRIKYYVYPDSADVTKPYVVTDPLRPPVPGDYADNDWITEEHLVQIDVWAKTRADKDCWVIKSACYEYHDFIKAARVWMNTTKTFRFIEMVAGTWANFTETTYKKGEILK